MGSLVLFKYWLILMFSGVFHDAWGDYLILGCFGVVNVIILMSLEAGSFYTYPTDPTCWYSFWGFGMVNCGPLGCLDEVWVMLMVTIFAKQIFMRASAYIFSIKTDYNDEDKINSQVPCWEREYKLKPITEKLMVTKFNELVTQFGLVTLFVAAFPLAPLFAFIVNLWDLRYSTRCFLLGSRRPLLSKSSGLGAWGDILLMLAYATALTNALTLAMTTKTIQRYIYLMNHSSMQGFLNWTLSLFDVDKRTHLGTELKGSVIESGDLLEKNGTVRTRGMKSSGSDEDSKGGIKIENGARMGIVSETGIKFENGTRVENECGIKNAKGPSSKTRPDFKLTSIDTKQRLSGLLVKLTNFKLGLRSFSQKPEKTPNIHKGSVTPLPPLSEPMPDLPPVEYATFKPEDYTTQVTILSNGLRVASEKKFGHFCTAGVVIDSGPRYEIGYNNGICHFLEKLSFGATHKFATRDVMLRELERHGGICDCQGSRDTTVYATSADFKGLDAVLAEVTLRPRLTKDEVESARQAVAFELETLSMRPEQETILMDMIHAAAFKDNTLGLPKICPKGNVNGIDRGSILEYLKNYYTPDRMVVAAVGVDHEPFVEFVQKYFVDMAPTWHSEEPFIPHVDKSVAKYTGGIVQEDCEIPLYPGSDLPELSHIVIGLESCSHRDDDFVATCVLNMMMGGGGSFSAGGPGKGMYTRLYTNVLNRYHWMFNATAYNHAYGDSGLFCVHASSPPSRLYDTAMVVARELVNMAGKVSTSELRRAKTQLQSMLLMNLEARPVVFEDVGRQVLATGKRKPPSYFIDEIG
ncbi:Mitochondrial-processing peptidase subunit alpha [Eumeta japonica]|uniref:Mitochondrial-processing peptidase subunit alpha n=1 Tax=Eumeta variegata TaxID=151549 RepID=A0A4C1TCC5_EUMVA|nr:Mitochondrial-processing peptidase subunit alpha [Eumeta japonica]